MLEEVSDCLCVCVCARVSLKDSDLLTTSMECRDMSILTRTLKYSVIWLLCISFSSISMATRGLLSTRNGSLVGQRPMW